MKFTFFSFLFFTIALSACQSNSEKKKSSSNEYEIDDRLPPSGEPLSNTEKSERLTALISESKRTLDSIDVAYSFISRERYRQQFSLDEREQVNEALIELNDAKDLIVLEMERNIISTLKNKTSELQKMTSEMNAQSGKLLRISQTLSKISSIIGNTTNMLAGALALGIIRPPLPDTKP